MTVYNVQYLAGTCLRIVKHHYPGVLPEESKMLVETCGEGCTHPHVYFDDVLSELLIDKKEPTAESTFLDLQNNTLQ